MIVSLDLPVVFLLYNDLHKLLGLYFSTPQLQITLLHFPKV